MEPRHFIRPGMFLLALLLLAGCATAPIDSSSETPAPTAPVAIKTPPGSEPDLQQMRLTIAGAGDIMIGTDYPENHLPDDDGYSFLEQVTPVFAAADISFGNLEGVLLDGGEPVKKCQNPSACYLFRSPTRYARHLKNAGFDVMSLANNHARDFGEEGRLSSMRALDKVGIQHSGKEGDVASWVYNDLRVAMIAFSPTRGAHNLLDIDSAAWLVSGVAQEHDIVIVSFHGGAEGSEGSERIGFGMEFAYGEKRGNVVAFSHAVIDAGADLVIGHGPHVPRAVEVYKERLVAYSLGNFATYYGISVAGPKGFAPILLATLDGTGRFRTGKMVSALQIRPGGPQLDPEQNAYRMIRDLSSLDFPDGGLHFEDDGRFWPLVQPLDDRPFIESDGKQ